MSMILSIEQERQAEARAAWAKGELVVGRQQALTLQFFARELAGAANRLRFLPGPSFGRLS
jgi:hypothetical protein